MHLKIDFTLYLRYRKSVMLPNGNFSFFAETANEEVLKVIGTRMDSIGLLTEINFVAALGVVPVR